MNMGDWFNSIAFLAVGIYVGLAVDGILKLDWVIFWIFAIGMPIVFWVFIALSGMIDGLIDRILPGGIKPARNPRPKERKPLLVLFSLPAGVVAGLVGARFGLAGLLL